ncbi:MAG: FKBP-type peptidyl-prolyl cis-trans isomerase [Bryobacteraceae bacterium]|nr:FKBP-type peptidyl-prolyl cis-trans isomerase [Bryobacteraceae bacterium]
MACAANLEVIAGILERRGAPLRQRLRSGVSLLLDIPGAGEFVRRQHSYAIRLRMQLQNRTPVRWPQPWGPVGASRLGDDGGTLYTEILLHRGRLVNGLFYGIDGMRVGGTRRLELAPHMAYGDRGVPGVIPPGAALFAEITILS